MITVKDVAENVTKALFEIEKDIKALAKATHIGTFDQSHIGLEVLRSYLIWLQFDPKNSEPHLLIHNYHHDNFELLHKFINSLNYDATHAWKQVELLNNPRRDQFQLAQEEMKKRSLSLYSITLADHEQLWMAIQDLQDVLGELKERFGLI